MRGIHVYAEWMGMTWQEAGAQIFLRAGHNGHVGYLWEPFPLTRPYATKVLVPEAFKKSGVPIRAKTLQARLPATLAAAEARERKLYVIPDPDEIERLLQSYRDFVALCVRKEAETGAPCLIFARC